MKHQAKRYKLGRTSKHRIALRYNLVRSLVLNGKIVTTHAKAKSIIPIADKLITTAGEESLANYRFVLSKMRGDEVTTKKIFEYGKQFKEKPGGYCRIIKIGQRKGDSAHQSCVILGE
jgi:large subunit ribosomal protein L17